ncbi:MAG: signal peptidase I [Verrucomicrobiota bacterium]|nr:signal peptidase I [Verrucomicrobiota bacterium]
MILRWLFSKTVRDAVAMRQHVQRLLHAQRDLLSPQAVGAVTLAINELRTATREGASMGRIRIKTEELQFAANKWLKPYPNPVWRENVEVLLVAIAVAMGIRTLFLQPFKIPTGSMQPTLYGVTSTPDFTRVNFFADNEAKLRAEYARQVNLEKSLVIPPFWERVKRWFQGISYIHVVAKADGVIDRISPMQHFLIFNIKQTIWIGGVPHTIWFPPDLGESPARYLTPLAVRAGFELDPDRVYHKGEDVVKMRVHAGDHLFVDRLTYNFRLPRRGEIIVFETHGIANMAPRDQDTFFIKRLVALPGDRVQIGDDRHLIINGRRLTGQTPHFANIFSFKPNQPPRDSHYSGYLNGAMAVKYDILPGLKLAPLFPDAQAVFTNGDDTYMVMGDNTVDSLDSRSWGPFPTKNVIGKSFFVYWPITRRFGWANE